MCVELRGWTYLVHLAPCPLPPLAVFSLVPLAPLAHVGPYYHWHPGCGELGPTGIRPAEPHLNPSRPPIFSGLLKGDGFAYPQPCFVPRNVTPITGYWNRWPTPAHPSLPTGYWNRWRSHERQSHDVSVPTKNGRRLLRLQHGTMVLPRIEAL